MREQGTTETRASGNRQAGYCRVYDKGEEQRKQKKKTAVALTRGKLSTSQKRKSRLTRSFSFS
jgi:hypothetical protein